MPGTQHPADEPPRPHARSAVPVPLAGRVANRPCVPADRYPGGGEPGGRHAPAAPASCGASRPACAARARPPARPDAARAHRPQADRAPARRRTARCRPRLYRLLPFTASSSPPPRPRPAFTSLYGTYSYDQPPPPTWPGCGRYTTGLQAARPGAAAPGLLQQRDQQRRLRHRHRHGHRYPRHRRHHDHRPRHRPAGHPPAGHHTTYQDYAVTLATPPGAWQA